MDDILFIINRLLKMFFTSTLAKFSSFAVDLVGLLLCGTTSVD
jgi:hypothetical protein